MGQLCLWQYFFFPSRWCYHAPRINQARLSKQEWARWKLAKNSLFQVKCWKLPVKYISHILRFCIAEIDKSVCKDCRVIKTPSARQQCWPESFCESGKFLQKSHYWLKNLRMFWKMSGYYTKYTDNIKSVRMNWKVSGWSKSVGMNWKVSRWCKKCPDNIKNVSGYSKKSLDDLKMYMYVIWKVSGWF